MSGGFQIHDYLDNRRAMDRVDALFGVRIVHMYKILIYYNSKVCKGIKKQKTSNMSIIVNELNYRFLMSPYTDTDNNIIEH